ncbi:MAG: hypothetical protein HY819_20595 [Acidobacteria bacterium]|nr:hypothetical protein [Acidobacteriota bacterium]
MKIHKTYKTILLIVFIFFTNCQTVHNPNKIARLGMLSSQADGAQVEFTAWIKEIVGDEKLGLELITSENDTQAYPLAIVTLKDGQKTPEKEKNLCFRGQILKRIEVGGGMVYYIKEAEPIECY